jgi:S-(hydroxymethyl)glutathione dehydrogenase/alcohol dehydrogenase
LIAELELAQPVTQAFGLGGFAAQALIHENQLAKIPVAMPVPQAALLGCGVVTGAGAAVSPVEEVRALLPDGAAGPRKD